MRSGEKLSRYIEERGITQAQLAARSGVSEGTVCKLCNGQDMSGMLDTWVRIARALNCKVSDILGE